MYYVYLLHFQNKVRGCSHYIGSTRAECYERRMREHARGHGARLTTHAYNLGTTFLVSRLWPSGSRQLEQEMKTRGHYKLLCPICTPRLRLELPTQPRSANVEGLAKSDFKGLGF